MQFKTKSPFGVGIARFYHLGFHPGLDPTGSMKKDKGSAGPGSYNLEMRQCAYKYIGGSPWKRKVDIEEYSQNMGFRNADKVEENKMRASLGGPGWYDIPPEVYKKKTFSNLKDSSFGMEERFKERVKSSNPPPGCYGKNVAETPVSTHKQFTPLPMFEWDGFVRRFKDPPSSLAANRYDPKPSFVEVITKKVVSKRGPYDLFTGPRENKNVKNHFTPPKFIGPINWIYTWPNDREILLNHPRKQRYGKFLKAKRMPDEFKIGPGPAEYNLRPKYSKKKNINPFNMSIVEPRPGLEWKVHPGPGRYNVQVPRCSKVKGFTWQFKSKTQRTEYKAPEYNAF